MGRDPLGEGVGLVSLLLTTQNDEVVCDGHRNKQLETHARFLCVSDSFYLLGQAQLTGPKTFTSRRPCAATPH